MGLGITAIGGRKYVSQMNKDDKLLVKCYQQIYGEQTQLYHYDTKLQLAFPFDLICALKCV